MKTKLLKKVRKRYSIIKITDLNRNAMNYLLEVEKICGLPFYVLTDSESKHSSNREGILSAHVTYDYALTELQKTIRIDYLKRYGSKRNSFIYTKVWWGK